MNQETLTDTTSEQCPYYFSEAKNGAEVSKAIAHYGNEYIQEFGQVPPPRLLWMIMAQASEDHLLNFEVVDKLGHTLSELQYSGKMNPVFWTEFNSRYKRRLEEI